MAARSAERLEVEVANRVDFLSPESRNMIPHHPSISLGLLVLLGLLGCSSTPSPEPAQGNPPRPEDSAAVAEVRSIVEACAAEGKQIPPSGYQMALDPASVRRTDSSQTWLIEMAEEEPYKGRLPPPGPPQRYVYRVDTAARSCSLVPPEQ